MVDTAKKVELDTESLHLFVTGMTALDAAKGAFAIAGLTDTMNEEVLDVMKYALVVPLSALGTTAEDFTRLSERAQNLFAEVKAEQGAA